MFCSFIPQNKKQRCVSFRYTPLNNLRFILNIFEAKLHGELGSDQFLAKVSRVAHFTDPIIFDDRPVNIAGIIALNHAKKLIGIIVLFDENDTQICFWNDVTYKKKDRNTAVFCYFTSFVSIPFSEKNSTTDWKYF